MIVHILGYIFLAVLIFIFNVVNNSYLPFIADIVFVILTIVGIAAVIIQRRSIEVEFESDNSVAEQTEKYLVRYIVRNKSFLPIVGCKLVTKVLHTRNNRKKTYKKTICCGGNSETVCEFYIDCPFCEMVTIECIKAMVSDFVGLICIPKIIKRISTVIVMPKLPAVDVIDKMSFVLNEEEGIIYSQERPGDDATEIFSIREYVPGDNVRKIHWKLTTKSNRFMVKDFGLPLKNNDTIIFDIFKEDVQNKENINEVYSLLYGLINAMTKRGYGFNFCYYNQEYAAVRVECQNDIIALFAQLYQIKPYEKSVTAAEIYYSNTTGKNNKMYYVTGYLNEFTMGQLNLLAGLGKAYYLIPEQSKDSYMPVRYEG